MVNFRRSFRKENNDLGSHFDPNMVGLIKQISLTLKKKVLYMQRCAYICLSQLVKTNLFICKKGIVIQSVLKCDLKGLLFFLQIDISESKLFSQQLKCQYTFKQTIYDVKMLRFRVNGQERIIETYLVQKQWFY